MDLVSVWYRNVWTDYAGLASCALLSWWPTIIWEVLNSGSAPVGRISPGQWRWELMSRSDFIIVILSEAKLQRSGRSPRGQAFNLRSNLDRSTKDTDRDV